MNTLIASEARASLYRLIDQTAQSHEPIPISGKRGNAVLASDPFQNPLPFEKLVGDLVGAFSRRINIQHHLVYKVFAQEKTVRVLHMWTHCE